MGARAWEWLRSGTDRDRGATMIEWAMIVSLICLVAVVGAALIGVSLDLRFDAADVAVRP